MNLGEKHEGFGRLQVHYGKGGDDLVINMHDWASVGMDMKVRWMPHESQRKFYNFFQHGTLLLKSLIFLVFLLKLWNSKH